MEQLKTLKDFGYFCKGGDDIDMYVGKDKLKEEAIKHIKAIRIHRAGVILKETTKIACEFWIKHSLDQDWIKFFFGISEGDLK